VTVRSPLGPTERDAGAVGTRGPDESDFLAGVSAGDDFQSARKELQRAVRRTPVPNRCAIHGSSHHVVRRVRRFRERTVCALRIRIRRSIRGGPTGGSANWRLEAARWHLGRWRETIRPASSPVGFNPRRRAAHWGRRTVDGRVATCCPPTVRRGWRDAAARHWDERQRVLRVAMASTTTDPPPNQRSENHDNGDRRSGEYDCVLFLHLISWDPI
jgi:hypothetical protein